MKQFYYDNFSGKPLCSLPEFGSRVRPAVGHDRLQGGANDAKDAD